MAKVIKEVFVRIIIVKAPTEGAYVIKSDAGPQTCQCPRKKCQWTYFKTRQQYFGKDERLYFCIPQKKSDSECWNGVGSPGPKEFLQKVIKKYELKDVKIVQFRVRMTSYDKMPKEDFKIMTKNAKRILKAGKKKGTYDYQVEKVEKSEYQKAIKTPLFGK